MTRHADADRPRRRVVATAIVLVVAFVVSGSVAMTVAGMETPIERDKKQPVEVVYSSDTEPAYVADVVASFAKDGGLNLRLHEVDDPASLLAAVRDSDASLLIVAAHGATQQAGEDSGLLVGEARVAQSDLEAAIAASGAKRVFVAACGLALPEEIADRPVTSFPDAIDMKIAAIHAISAFGEIYQEETATTLYPVWEKAIGNVAPQNELIFRHTQPIDPLSPSSTHNQNEKCYDYNCEHSRNNEEQGQARIDGESGGVGGIGVLSFGLGALVDKGVVQAQAMPHPYAFGRHGVDWHALLTVDVTKWYAEAHGNQCPIMWQARDMVLPGLSPALNALKARGIIEMPNAQALALRACGQVYLGVVHGDGGHTYAEHNAGGGGRIMLQLGSGFEFQVVKFKWFKWTFTVQGWAGVTGTFSMTIEADMEEEVAHITFHASANLVAFAKSGWGGLYAGLTLVEGWQREVLFGWGNEASQSSSGPGGIEAGGITYRDISMTQVLNKENLNAIRASPGLAAELSEALGTDATQLVPGTVVDLGDPAVCRVFSGADAPCGETEEHLPGGFQLPVDIDVGETPDLPGAGPLGPTPASTNEECDVSADQSAGFAGVQVCADATHGGGASGGVSVGGIDAEEVTGESDLDYGPAQQCNNVVGDDFICKAASVGASSTGLVGKRLAGEHALSLLFDVDADSGTVFVSLCAEGAFCPEDAVGASGFGLTNVVDSATGAAGYANQVLGDQYQNVGGDTLLSDVGEWVGALG